MSSTTSSRITRRYWTPEEDEIIKRDYQTKGRRLDLPNRTLRAIQQRATRLGLIYLDRWSEEETMILKQFYPAEGAKGVARRIKRSALAIKVHAVLLKIKCLCRSNGDRIWTEEEIALVRLRYPIEGAIQLAQTLSRTEQSIRMCAQIHGIKIDRARYRMFSEGRLGSSAKTFRGHGRVYGTYANRLKDRGLPCDIDARYLDSITTDICPLSGLAVTYPKFSDDSEATASLGRIDSSKGYVKGNVQWVHKDINMMKRDMSERQLFDYALAIVQTLSSRYLK